MLCVSRVFFFLYFKGGGGAQPVSVPQLPELPGKFEHATITTVH